MELWWGRVAAGDMPQFRDPGGEVWTWDPTTHTYVKRPEKAIPDRSHASGGDNELFDPATQTELPKNPLMEGYMARTADFDFGGEAPEPDVVYMLPPGTDWVVWEDVNGALRTMTDEEVVEMARENLRQFGGSDVDLLRHDPQTPEQAWEVINEIWEGDPGGRGWQLRVPQGAQWVQIEFPGEDDPRWGGADPRVAHFGSGQPPAGLEVRQPDTAVFGDEQMTDALKEIDRHLNPDDRPGDTTFPEHWGAAFAEPGQVLCPNCQTSTELPQCPQCGKGLKPEWDKRGETDPNETDFAGQVVRHPDGMPDRAPKRNRMKTDDTYPSMLSSWRPRPGEKVHLLGQETVTGTYMGPANLGGGTMASVLWDSGDRSPVAYAQLTSGPAAPDSMGVYPVAKQAADDWGLDAFSDRTEVGKWIQDVTGQLHATADYGGENHEQLAQEWGLDWNSDIGALGSVFDDGSADTQWVKQGFQFDPKAVEPNLQSIFQQPLGGKLVHLNPPAGEAQQKEDAFQPFEIRAGQWIFPPGVPAATGVAWVKERSDGVQFRPGMVLVAEHLQPDDFHLYSQRPAAIITATGGSTSHAALIAREQGWPVVIGIGGDAYSKIETGNYVKVDNAGQTTNPRTITVMPTPNQQNSQSVWDSILRYRQDQERNQPSLRPSLPGAFGGLVQAVAARVAAAPSLDSCPDCGGPLTERGDEKICHDCGTRQPIIALRAATAAVKAPMVNSATGEPFEGLLVVASVHGQGVGYLVGEPYGEGYRTDYIYVDPSFRRGGIGKQLAATARENGLIPYVTQPDQVYSDSGAALAGALYGHHSLSRTARRAVGGPALAVPAEALLGGGAAAGGAAGGGGLMAGLMGGGEGVSGIGGLMRGAMNPGSFLQGQGLRSLIPGQGGPAGPSPNASVPPEGPTGAGTFAHFLYADTFGEEETGRATKNRGENSDPDTASSTGIEGEKEHGDSPEQLKDVDGGPAKGMSDATDPYGDPDHWSDEQKDAVRAFEVNLPLIQDFAESEDSGADHPIIQAIDAMLEDAFPGYKELGDGGEEPDGEQVESLEELSGKDLDGDDEAGEGEEHKDAVQEGPDEDEDEEDELSKLGGAPVVDMGGYGIIDPYSRPGQGGGQLGEMGLVTDAQGNVVGQFIRHNDNGTIKILTGEGYKDVDPRSVTVQKAASELFRHADFAPPFGNDAQQTPPVTGVPTCPTCGQNHMPGTPCPTGGVQQPQAQPMVGMQPMVQPGVQPKVVTHATESHIAKWADTEGNPLKVGADYELRSPGYAVPDYVVVDHVLPDKLVYTITSGDMKYRDSLTAKEVRTQGLEFAPKVEGPTSKDGFEATAAHGDFPDDGGFAPGLGPDADLPMELPEDFPLVCPNCGGGARAGATACPHCGSRDIKPGIESPIYDEAPVRPGADPIPQVDDLTEPPTRVSTAIIPGQGQGGAYPDAGHLAEWEAATRNQSDAELRQMISSGKLSPEAVAFVQQKLQERARMQPQRPSYRETLQDQAGRGLPMGQYYPPGDPRRTQGSAEPEAFEGLEDYTGSFKGDSPDDRSWLMEGSPGQGVDVDPALMAKLAGKDFSPREQREFIDESGEARNLGKLDLDGTHYIADETDSAFNW